MRGELVPVPTCIAMQGWLGLEGGSAVASANRRALRLASELPCRSFPAVFPEGIVCVVGGLRPEKLGQVSLFGFKGIIYACPRCPM